MAKIENTTVYPLTTPSVDDFIIGTDTSDENRTVSFSIESITATSLLQGLQSVLDTGSAAVSPMSLTGDLTVTGDIAPTTITAASSPGTAGQLLSSTGTGIEWVDSTSAQNLDSVLTAGNTTTNNIVMTGGNISTTGNIVMSGASQQLLISNGTTITLGVGSSITTTSEIILQGPASVLNFGAEATISDYANNTGTIGQVLTVNAAGTGVEWSTGIPVASIPTLQQVLTSGNIATSNPINLVSSNLLLDSSSNIESDGANIFTGNNVFDATGTTASTSAIALSGSLWDGASTGTVNQVLTSTTTGVQWQSASAVGVSSVTTTTPVDAASPQTPITITPTSGAVLVTQNIYNGGSLIGCVPDSGTASTFLRGDGTWVTPTGAVSSVSVLASGTSAGLTDAIKITPTTGTVQVQSNAFAGSDKVGHVPDSSAAVQNTTFLRADGTWAAPAGGGGSSAPEWVNRFVINNGRWNITAGNYMVNPGITEIVAGSVTSMYSQSLGASTPAAVALSDLRFTNNLIQLNPGTGGCSTGFPNHTLCEVGFQFYCSLAATYTWELWRVPISGGVADAAVAATALIVSSASTLQTGVFTLGASNVLAANEGFILTCNSGTTTSNDYMGMNLFFKYTATV